MRKTNEALMYLQQHAAIVELYSECGRIETHVYVKDSKP